jgi:hypothetical protein
VQTSVFFFADDPGRDFSGLNRDRLVNDASSFSVITHFDMARDREIFSERMTNESVIGENSA